MTEPHQVEFSLNGVLRLLIVPPQPANRPGCMVTLRYDGFTVTARGEGMAYTLPGDKQVHVQVAYVDADGHPASVDGDVAWASSDESIATVTVDDDDSTLALVRPGDTLGQAQITATADADLGGGVRELITTMDVDIVAGEAVAGTISPVGEPEPIPEVNPLRKK